MAQALRHDDRGLRLALRPAHLLEGLVGRLFREFAVVVVGAVLISAFVALTLSPMMCRFVLDGETRHGRLHRATQPFFDALDRGYRRSLEAFLARRWLALPAILGHIDTSNDVRALGFTFTALILLLVGLVVGAVGSTFTLRRYLKI